MKHTTWRILRHYDLRLVYPSSDSVSMSSCCLVHQPSPNQKIYSIWCLSLDLIYSPTSEIMGSVIVTPKPVDSLRDSISMDPPTSKNYITYSRTTSWSGGWRWMCWVSYHPNAEPRLGYNVIPKSQNNFKQCWWLPPCKWIERMNFIRTPHSWNVTRWLVRPKWKLS